MDPKTAKKAETGGAQALMDTWERAAGAWWDAWAQSPAFIGAAAKVLESQLAFRGILGAVSDAVLPAWRLPAAREVAMLSERVAALELRLARMEAGIPAESSTSSSAQ